jgi:hypothetical protein
MDLCAAQSAGALTTFEDESSNMATTFPSITTTSMIETEPGSIVWIARHDGLKLALVTDHIVNGVRSFVWLNPNFPNKPAAIFAEGWQNDPSVFCFGHDTRFELGLDNDTISPNGRSHWDTPGVIVSINDALFIRAAPDDQFYGDYRLVNIRDGTLYSGRPPNNLLTVLHWELWIRDPAQRADHKLTEFRPDHC